MMPHICFQILQSNDLQRIGYVTNSSSLLRTILFPPSTELDDSKLLGSGLVLEIIDTENGSKLFVSQLQ